MLSDGQLANPATQPLPIMGTETFCMGRLSHPIHGRFLSRCWGNASAFPRQCNCHK